MPLPNTSFAAGRRVGRARSWRAKVAVLRLSRRSVLRAAGGATAMLALLTPVAALANQVPAAASLKAQLVTGAPKPAVAARSVPLRVEDPAQYAREKATADRSYGAWAAAHSSVFGPGLSIHRDPGAVAAGSECQRRRWQHSP